MKRTPLMISVLVSALVAIGCGDKDKSRDKDPEPAAKTTEAPKADPAKPAKVEYSPETADKLIAELAKCTSKSFCDPYQPLLSFGTKVTPKLVEVAADAKAGRFHKIMAMTLLKEIKDPAAAMPMFEAAKAEPNFVNRYDLYETAAACGGDEVFKAMTSFYASKEGKKHKLQMRRGLKLFGPKLVAWAAEQMKTTKDQVGIADLIGDAATASDKDTVAGLLKICKHRMACHRLAAAAIRLGDVSQFSVLLDGLRSKDVYDRADAANFFAKVATKLPADKKDEAIKLLQAGKAKDRGGLTAIGYTKSLKALGAE